MAPPPARRSARNAAMTAPTPPPTSGPTRAKRGRRPVDEEVDEKIDDTPVKKKKTDNGKGKAKEVVEIDEDEREVEDLGEAGEEQDEDAHRYDPEREALGEDDEEAEEVEEAEVVDLKEYTGRARRVEKKAGSRRPARAPIHLDRVVASFTAISIGVAGPLHTDKSMDVIKACHVEFRRRMENTIRQRSALARSHRLDGPDFPMSPRMRQWFTERSEEEIWKLVKSVVSQERQIILGGIWLHVFTFEDLPAPTEEELSKWLVYGDLVNNVVENTHAMYVGSATAARGKGFGFGRLGCYERAKRRADAGEDVSPETTESSHLRAALQTDAVMELRIIAVFDPLAPLALPLMMEGIFVDFLQSFNRSWRYKPENAIFSSPGCLSSYNAAAEKDALWTGLNGAHPFRQGIRTDSTKRLSIKAQGATCEICLHHLPDMSAANWIDSKKLSHILECQHPWVCYRCVHRAEVNPEYGLEQIRAVRSGSTKENSANSHAFKLYGMSADEVRAQLTAMEHCCPCCKSIHADMDIMISKWWRPMDPAWASLLGDANWICSNCQGYLTNRLANKSVEEAIEHLRQYNALKMDFGANDSQAKAWETKQKKFDLLIAQEGKCAICKEVTWDVDTATVKGIDNKVMQMPEDWDDGTQPLACRKCAFFFKDHKDKPDWSARFAAYLSGEPFTKGKPSTKDVKFGLLIAQEGKCGVCKVPTWDVTTTTVDNMAAINRMPANFADGTQPLVCETCRNFVRSHKKKPGWSARFAAYLAKRAGNEE